MHLNFFGFVLVFSCFYIVTAQLDIRHVKCLVCRATVEEIEKVVQKVDPKKKIDVGSYRLDGDGNTKQKIVPFGRSETHLTEVMETVCDKMDDYVRATYKSNGELTLLKMIDDSGKMNPDMGIVDFIQDGDLNKSLKYYCERIVEEFEDSVIKFFGNKDTENIDIKLCTDVANYCDVTHTEADDYEFEEREEL